MKKPLFTETWGNCHIQGIAVDSDLNFSDAFYVVKFDVAKNDRFDIPAENSDIMSAVYLKEVIDDYNGTGIDKEGNAVPHKYGCSGIDGLTFAPLPGKSENDGLYLYVAYGIYSDLNRDDNDHQILLCYDFSDWCAYAQPLNQKICTSAVPPHRLTSSLYAQATPATVYKILNMTVLPSLFLWRSTRDANPISPTFLCLLLTLKRLQRKKYAAYQQK